MKWRVSPSRVSGQMRLPGDKSLSRRALIMAAMANGRSEIRGLSDGADVRSTADCLRRLGVIIRTEGDVTVVESGATLAPPQLDLCAGNSGTTMRLLAGVLAAQPYSSRLTGDESLSKRPMERVAEPLRRMGAAVATRDGVPPLEITGARLNGIHYQTPVASAQVKSAVLLAGVYASGETSVTEPVPSRDHTERMLDALGVPVRISGTTASISGGSLPRPLIAGLPGDPSSAAFFFAAASLTGGQVVAENMLLNPTRLGFGRVLERMGVRVQSDVRRHAVGEPVGTMEVEGPPTRAVTIAADEVPSLIDELPLVALLATQISGVTSVRGAAELRTKETDRIEAVASSLGAMGANVQALPDGFEVRGPTVLSAAELDSRGDHRLAMTLSVAGLIANGITTIAGAEAAEISFPNFPDTLRRLGADLEIG
jgi:3-phosphoshikimate 1-carboxyvinyltransferase